jgi:hypothetical protein
MLGLDRPKSVFYSSHMQFFSKKAIAMEPS